MHKVVRIARRSGMKGSELGCHRLAHHDRAGRPRLRRTHCIPGGTMTGVDRRPIARRHVARIDQIFDSDREPVEQAGRWLRV